MRILITIFCCLFMISCCRLTNHIPFFGDNSVEKSSSKEKSSHKEKKSEKHSKKNKNALILKKSFPIPQKKPGNDMEVPEEMKKQENWNFDVESGRKWFWEDRGYHKCDREKN